MKVLLGFLLAMGFGSAVAQAPNPYEGTWKASWAGPARPLEATVVIRGNAGRWKTLASSRHDACLGREAPIQVSTASPEALVFTIRFSEALAGCKDSAVELKPDGKGLKGTRASKPIELQRN